MNKKTVLALIAVVAVLAIMAGVYLITRPDTQEGTKTFTMVIVHGDGSEKILTIKTDKTYVSEAMLDEKLIVESDSPGLYTTVDGELADYNVNQSYWAFYEGDAYANEGMNTTPIQDGATYKLVYTIG